MFKEQELILAQSVARLAIWEWDPETNVVTWLPGSLPLFGRPIGELASGQSILECLLPEDQHVLRKALDQALNGPGKYSIEFRVQHPNGEIRWILSRGQTGTTSERRVVLGVNSDITDRRLTEAQLRAQAKLLELAFEPILVRDANDRIAYWNKGAERLYGYSWQEAKGQSSHELLATKSSETWESILQQMEEKGQWEGELIHRTKQGKLVHVASRWQKLPYFADNLPFAVLETNFDLSQQRELQTARLWEQRAKLIGQMAHEINNPLAAASGAASLLRRECGSQAVEQYTRILEDSIKRIAEFIRRSNELHQSQKGTEAHLIQ